MTQPQGHLTRCRDYYNFRRYKPQERNRIDGIRTRHWFGSSRSAPDEIEDLLRMFNCLWRRAQYVNLSRLHGSAGVSSCFEPEAVEFAIKLGLYSAESCHSLFARNYLCPDL
jgi:hypothetical protein